MRRTYIDDVCEAADAVPPVIKLGGCLTHPQQRLKLLHRRCVIFGVVERDVPDLRIRLSKQTKRKKLCSVP